MLRSDPIPVPQQEARPDRILTIGIATLVVAGLTYLFAIGATLALALLAVPALLVLLVAWGFWVLNNTLQL